MANITIPCTCNKDDADRLLLAHLGVTLEELVNITIKDAKEAAGSAK